MRLCWPAKTGFLVRAFAFGAGLALCADAAGAASCSSLKSELSRLESGSSAKSPAAQKWSTAKSAQQKAITAAERDASYFGCATSGSDKCTGLNSKIKRMKANLAAIERQLSKAGGGSSGNAKRARQVRAALARQNCDAPPPTREAAADDKPRSLLARLFNPQQPQAEPVSATTGDREIAAVRRQTRSASNQRRLPSGGTFRTLCVRTCDGYFFPVSYTAGKDQFAYDASRCSEICPAAETHLYVYRNPGGDQTQMMSLAGDLYAEQPFAYRYKSEYVEGCSCRATRQSKLQSAWTEIGTGAGSKVFFSDISSGLPRRSLTPSRGGTFEDKADLPSPLARTPLTRAQLPRYDDPDTLLNLEKGFDVTKGLDLAAVRHDPAPDATAEGRELRDGLPVLSIQSRPIGDDDGEEVAAFAPVFKSDDDGLEPAGERKGSVRVVGPEYFVAQ
ncbi:DUF2865 domain-containing protein [Roseibium sp. M-1]